MRVRSCQGDAELGHSVIFMWRGGRCMCGMCPCACSCVRLQQMVLTCCGGKQLSGPVRTRQGAATDHLQLFSRAAVGVKSAAVLTGPVSRN